MDNTQALYFSTIQCDWRLEVDTASETLGKTHQIVLVLKRAFALFLKYRGRHTEALKLFQGILKAKNEQLGEQHHDSLTAMEDLGHTLSLLGHSTEAANIAERSSLLHQNHSVLGRRGEAAPR